MEILARDDRTRPQDRLDLRALCTRPMIRTGESPGRHWLRFALLATTADVCLSPNLQPLRLNFSSADSRHGCRTGLIELLLRWQEGVVLLRVGQRRSQREGVPAADGAPGAVVRLLAGWSRCDWRRSGRHQRSGWGGEPSRKWAGERARAAGPVRCGGSGPNVGSLELDLEFASVGGAEFGEGRVDGAWPGVEDITHSAVAVQGQQQRPQDKTARPAGGTRAAATLRRPQPSRSCRRRQSTRQKSQANTCQKPSLSR